MKDAFAVRSPSRPAAVPDGCVAWNGYILPQRGRTFRRQELIEIALANGYRLTPELLKKWRLWRLLPGPTAGGATGRGRGKGQTWPEGAGWRVAWIGRWHTATLTYEVLRLALWPWTPEIERDQADQLARSVARFLAQDRIYHDAVLEVMDEPLRDQFDPYMALIYDGEVTPELTAAIGASEGANQSFLRRLNFDAMSAALDDVAPSVLSAYIAAFRSSLADRHAELIRLFWDSPLTLSRVVVRELYRFVTEIAPP